ncbi:MAG: DUF3592 domain-containing protein [Desulfomicrobium sp.]|nr:DUF3592 domain-containing protein [Desulfomicrobium sp.]NLV96901.1 DUF3592 domain-containing protein [Desulfovibrionales bacterium]
MFSSLRKLVLLVLGIPFVIVGSRFLLDVGESLITHQAAQSWTPHQAVLTSVELFSSQDQAMGNQTVVDYQYFIGADEFHGQFSCVGAECPESGLYQHLAVAKEEGRSVTILVNPKIPKESLLYRHVHLPLIFLKIGVGLFCFVTGAAAVIFGVYLLHGPGANKGVRP